MNKSIIIIFFILTSIILKPYIISFLAGLLLAIIFIKPLKFLNEKRNNPKQNALLICGGSFLFLVLPMLFLIISGAIDLTSMIKHSEPMQISVVKESAFNYINKFQTLLDTQYSIKIDIKSHLPKVLEVTSKQVLHFGEVLLKSLPSLILNLLITFLSSFFILLYSDTLKSLYLNLIPFPVEQSELIAKTIQKVAESILIASVIAAILQATMVGLSILITPFENITLWVFFAFILSFVPVIGTTPIVLFLISASWINNDYYSLIVFLLMWGCLGLIDNVLRPFLIGNKANLNPFLAFLSALGGVSLMGFIGLFVGPIIVGTFVDLLRNQNKD